MESRLALRQNWESLRVFTACARLLSFTRAAEELGLTQAAVSQRVAQLEARLGTTLFRRRPRLALTAEGARLAPRIALAFSSIERALQEVCGPRVLSVTTTPTVATLWLLQRLPDFRRRHPEVSVALDVTEELRPLDDDRFDVAVRAGDGRWPGLEARPLFPLELTPFVSRRLVRDGRRLTLEGLARLPLVPEEAWADWFRAAGGKPPPPARRGELLVRSQHMVLEAVLAGEGAGLLTPRFVEAHVERGRMLRPFRQVLVAGHYYVAWRTDRGGEPLIGAFRDWVRAAAADAR